MRRWSGPLVPLAQGSQREVLSKAAVARLSYNPLNTASGTSTSLHSRFDSKAFVSSFWFLASRSAVALARAYRCPGRSGWLYVAFITDAYAKRIVGRRASSSMTTDFVLDALEQALYDRRPTHPMA